MTTTQTIFYSLDLNEFRFRFAVVTDPSSPLYGDKVGIEVTVSKPTPLQSVYYSQSVSVEVDGIEETYAFSPNSGFRIIPIFTARLIWCELVKKGWQVQP